MNRYFQRPLIPLSAVAYLGSLSGASLFQRPWLWLLAGGVWLLASGLFRKQAAGFPCLLVSAFCVFAGLAGQAACPRPDDISFWAPRRDMLLRGTLTDLPRSAPGFARWSALVQCREAEWHGATTRISGRVQISVPGLAPAWNPGDTLQVLGKLSLPAGPMNPGELNEAAFLQAKGVTACLAAAFPGDACRLDQPRWWHEGPWSGGLYRWLSQGIRKNTPARSADWVKALVLGDRSGLNPLFSERLAAVGLAHLLAISGMKVGVVFVSLLSLGTWLRMPRTISLFFAMTGTALFALSTGAQPPALRATLMILAVAAGYFSGRKPDSLSGLCFSGMVILACDPLACRDAGFQLSYAGTIAIVLALPILEGCPRFFPGFAWVVKSLLLSGVALLLILPLTLYYFYSFMPAALFANLAALPLLDVIMMAGLAAGIVHGGWPVIGGLAGWVAALSSDLVKVITDWALRFPEARIFICQPPAWWVLGVYGALGLATWKPARTLGLAGVAISILVYPLFQPAAPSPGELRMTCLSLNIGEAALVETASGKRLMVDTGTENDFLKRVKPFLASRGINHLDGLLLSHLDSDHAGGALACMTCFRVTTLLTSEFPKEDQPAAGPILAAAKACGIGQCPMLRGEAWNLDSNVRLEALWPPAGDEGPRNQRCLVVRLTSPEGKILFTGDSPGDVEAQWSDPDCDVLKVSHHGSRTSSHPAFLGRILPQWAVIMPGNRNPFGFPNPDALERLAAVSGGVLSTHTHGALEITLRKEKPARWRIWK